MTSLTSATHVSTQRVARALGVSISTVKRWVDEGVLPAYKTAGGHRKLLIADVLEMARRGELPRADLSQLIAPGPLPNDAELAGQLYRALVSGEIDKVRTLIHGSYRQGASIDTLADRAIAPAMKQIGLDWQTGRIDVMEEHRASQACAAVLYELKAVLEDRAGKNRPRAVGGAAAGDQSVLPTLLAQMVLLDAGWEAVSLGPNTPFSSLQKAVKDLRPRLMWVSVSHPVPEKELLTEYRRFHELAQREGVAVAVGGRALAESIRSQMPYTTHGDTLGHLVAFAQSLQPRPRRPRRGRPRS